MDNSSRDLCFTDDEFDVTTLTVDHTMTVNVLDYVRTIAAADEIRERAEQRALTLSRVVDGLAVCGCDRCFQVVRAIITEHLVEEEPA